MRSNEGWVSSLWAILNLRYYSGRYQTYGESILIISASLGNIGGINKFNKSKFSDVFFFDSKEIE